MDNGIVNNNNYKAYFLLTLTALFWSGNFIVGKAASNYEIPPFSLNFYRWLFAFIILLPFTYKEIINNKKYILENIGFFIILGITSITVFNSIVYYSLYHTQVISGVLMISTIPVWIMFIASLFKIEKTNIFQIIGVVLSLTGVLFIITKFDFNILLNLDFNKGDLSALFAMFSWSLYSALLKKKKYELSQISLLQVVIIFGVIYLFPIYLINIKMGSVINLNIPFFLILFYVVLLPGITSFFFWIKGVALIGANKAGIYLHLMPILATILAMLIYKEQIMFYHYIGAIFIISGIIFSNKKNV